MTAEEARLTDLERAIEILAARLELLLAENKRLRDLLRAVGSQA